MAAAPESTPVASARVTWRTVALAAASALGMVLASLDFAVNVGLPAMRDAFGTDLAAVQWVIVVFIATRAGLALGAGAFADRFGLRMVYLFGTATYLVSMVCMSLSPNAGDRWSVFGYAAGAGDGLPVQHGAGDSGVGVSGAQARACRWGSRRRAWRPGW